MTRSLNKEYDPIGGEGDFCQEGAKLTFGENSKVLTAARNVTVQGISGTGSLKIGADIITPGTRTTFPSPTTHPSSTHT